MTRRVDLILDAVRTLRSSAVRSTIAAGGIVLGVAGIVAISTLSASSAVAVSDAFEAGRPRIVTAAIDRRAHPTITLSDVASPGLSERLHSLPGVESGGGYWSAPERSLELGETMVVQVGAEVLTAAQAEVTGRLVRASDDALRLPVCNVGRALVAEEILGTSIDVGTYRCTVVGIIERTGAIPELLGAVVVPAWPRVYRNEPSSVQVLVRTPPGQGGAVARWLPTAVLPRLPDATVVNEPYDPRTIHDLVDAGVRALGLAASGLLVLVGALAASAVATVGVVERTAEIGMRRALGATRGDTVALVMTENLLLGVCGAALGCGVGLAGAAVFCAARDWPFAVESVALAGAFAVGAVAGVVSGAIPALRAGLIQPATALSG